MERVELWPDPPGEAPGREFTLPEVFGGSRAVRAVTRPTLLPFPLEARHPDTAVLICPGGGMLFVSTENEGTPVAERANGGGLSAYVLEYRTLPTSADDEPSARFLTGAADGSLAREVAEHAPLAAADVADAVSWARARHDAVVVVGFSAGAVAAVHAIVDDGLEVDAAAAVYLPQHPAATSTPSAPPLFIAAAADDVLGISGSLDLFASWRRHGRPAELHLIETGSHGFGLGTAGTTSDGWFDLLLAWLRAHRLA